MKFSICVMEGAQDDVMTLGEGGLVFWYPRPITLSSSALLSALVTSAVFGWLRVESPTLITELKYNFVRPLTSASRPSVNDADVASFLGFKNVNYTSDPITAGMPWLEMRPTSYAALGDPTFIPMETEDHNHQVAGSITKMMGAHSIKMGGGVVFRLFAVLPSSVARILWSCPRDPHRCTMPALGPPVSRLSHCHQPS